ncbi:MAG: hypothetical protein SGARI_007042 [Bacillariaceae sp.]
MAALVLLCISGIQSTSALNTCAKMCPWTGQLSHGTGYTEAKNCDRVHGDSCSNHEALKGWCERVSLNTRLCLDGIVDGWKQCKGYCHCNIFGANCDACGECAVQRKLRGLSETEEQERGECDEYNEYMLLSVEEKFDLLPETIIESLNQNEEEDGKSSHCWWCGILSLEAKTEIVEAVQKAAAASTNGETLTCEDFNNAYNQDVAIDALGSLQL